MGGLERFDQMFARSVLRVSARLERGVVPMWSRNTKRRRARSLVLHRG